MFLIRWFLCYFVVQLHCQSDLRQSSNCVSKIVMFEPQADREPIFLRALSAPLFALSTRVLFFCSKCPHLPTATITETPQIRKQIFTENGGKFSHRQLWEFVGFFWDPWTLNLKNHSKAFWGETPPRIQPTDLQLICAAFGSRTDVRWLHFQSILRLEDLDTSVQS